MELIRKVKLDDYVLELFDTLRSRNGKDAIGYRFTRSDNGQVIFCASDFYCSPLHAMDSDDCVRSLLTFLTLRLGDTDREYFDEYTELQIKFRDSDAEYLALYSLNLDDGGLPLIDCDDCPHCEAE